MHEVALGLRKCEDWLRHRRDVECVSWACIVGAVSSAVSRVLYRSIAIADLLHRVSLWLVCDGAALREIVCAVDCSCVCVSLRCIHACVTAALQCVSGAALHACVVGGCGGRWQSMLRTTGVL